MLIYTVLSMSSFWQEVGGYGVWPARHRVNSMFFAHNNLENSTALYVTGIGSRDIGLYELPLHACMGLQIYRAGFHTGGGGFTGKGDGAIIPENSNIISITIKTEGLSYVARFLYHVTEVVCQPDLLK